ncbi:MAG: glutathione S-transferase family protein [Henriciella sp.]|nr:glutathione S-transferase family protein [Henriciella sp.]
MSAYRLFGSETSPYSVKVRSFLRYKGVEFEWVGRSSATEEEFQALAKVPTVPLLLSPNRPANQDSTSILATVEADFDEPSAVPEDPACAVLALILEDYADEWLNKLMFFNRWGQKPDRVVAGERTLEQLLDGNLPRAKAKARDQIIKRMKERLPLVGIEKKNEKLLKASFERFFALLNAHLEKTLFLFGGRPSAADFAVAGQVHQLLLDPTPADWLQANAPFVVAWSEFMEAPKAGGPFKPLSELADTLLPLMRDEVAVTYLPWATANVAAAAGKADRTSIKIDGKAYEQVTQHYAARAFKSVLSAIEAGKEAEGLADFMDAAGIKV